MNWSTAFNFLGRAKQNGSVQLTDLNQGPPGAMWLKTPVDIHDGFVCNFSFKITKQQYSIGADGMALVFQCLSNKEYQPNAGGDKKGYGDLKRCVAIEFDTYRSHPDQHISVQINSSDITRFTSKYLTNQKAGITLNDGQIHHVELSYKNGLCNLSLDKNVVLNGYQLPLPNLIGTSSDVFIGFTAATGYYFQMHEIISFSLHHNNEDIPQVDIVTDITTPAVVATKTIKKISKLVTRMENIKITEDETLFGLDYRVNNFIVSIINSDLTPSNVQYKDESIYLLSRFINRFLDTIIEKLVEIAKEISNSKITLKHLKLTLKTTLPIPLFNQIGLLLNDPTLVASFPIKAYQYIRMPSKTWIFDKFEDYHINIAKKVIYSLRLVTIATVSIIVSECDSNCLKQSQTVITPILVKETIKESSTLSTLFSILYKKLYFIIN
ncbi:hypothetical protein DLAC_00986 [Tieghemostelium lacteum]|uniref:Legume lectin domain-containing protein n=1 Tax=Tieghemostelium lacteum TaxID=361077 RepID=A0A152A7F5_TIELA|nr:hypothetical protein DLAC_00986 [Tieghemostelium lacteum]|eukprot:KYR02172.1 hypothetical protein DLAC_00986 [Tieghemostelium lacteum]